MNQNVTVSFDRILWKWWLGKDSDEQEAFEDLIETIILNLEDLDISPWKSTMMQEFPFQISNDNFQVLNTARNNISLEEYLNGCLKYFREQEENMKNIFNI